MLSLTICFWRFINNPKWENLIPSWHTVNFAYMAKLIKHSEWGWFLFGLGLKIWHQLLKKNWFCTFEFSEHQYMQLKKKKRLNTFLRAPKLLCILTGFFFFFNFSYEFLVADSNCKPFIILTSAFKPCYCKGRVICALKWCRREIHKLLASLWVFSSSTSGCGSEQLPQSVC